MRAALIVLVLAGCSSIPQAPTVASVAVATSCVPKDPPKRPEIYSDADLAGMDDYRFVLALRWNGDRLLEYVRELEAVLKGCAGPAQ